MTILPIPGLSGGTEQEPSGTCNRGGLLDPCKLKSFLRSQRVPIDQNACQHTKTTSPKHFSKLLVSADSPWPTSAPCFVSNALRDNKRKSLRSSRQHPQLHQHPRSARRQTTMQRSEKGRVQRRKLACRRASSTAELQMLLTKK